MSGATAEDAVPKTADR